jgi:hypothetical protein
VPEDAMKIESLAKENEQLRWELKAAEVREELARTLPHVLKKRGQKKS